ncbi:alpha/beta hydrolase [Allokutzneria albata]|uniref:Pimeloyl-ACP methyl ester carboxylesterase n=1 Tax=Allokutzneria albata TaxID=211114 RepID=A0A1G9Y556_ALLAB|nr:alpha/beta fold hydrolase [Allokutzneria albata]SDN04167.1 Pimeloyl-ACP methyl ester carboxylesterase [Allokutzneria albata]
MRLLLRRVAAAAVALLSTGAVLTPAQASAAEAACRDLNIPVSLVDVPLLGFDDQTMYGRLCVPAGGSRTLQVLVPGGTYNSAYYDPPGMSEDRSFRKAANKAGYATLAVDRVGSGRSSKPLSALLSASAQANAVHHAIQAMRKGTLGPKFDKIVLVGHSLGSATTIIEAATFRDVDGVVITGFTHRVAALTVVPTVAALGPALLDEKMGKVVGLDPAYLTTGKGMRYDAFHRPGPLDQQVLDMDEATKDLIAAGEIVDAVLIGLVLPYSKRINVPVLVAMGEKDGVFCGLLASDCSSAAGLREGEAGYYSPEAKLRTFVLPGYGHSINYAPNAPLLHDAVTGWADEMVGK